MSTSTTIGRKIRNLLLTITSAVIVLGAVAFAVAPQLTVAQTPLSQGEQAYSQALAHFANQLQLVGDPGQAEAFKKEWEHKFDSQLDTQEGVQKAVMALVEASSRQGCPVEFDGKCLYLRALRAYAQFHHSPGDGPDLADPAQRATWLAEWEHKFDKTGDFDTEAGTDSAIRKMRDSLGQRFDYVMSVSGTKEERDRMKAQFVGIGVPVDMNNSSQVVLGAALKLQVHEPSKGSPAYGKVFYGDTIVKLDGMPVDGMTIEKATKKFVGKVGSTMSITVERKDADGKAQLIDLVMTRAHTVNELRGVAPTGPDADIGVPVEITGREEIKLGKGFELVAHTPFEGSPSTGKIVDGDFIVKVDGKSIDGLTINQAVDKIRGTAGSTVVITVERKEKDGEVKLVDLTITRRAIEQHAVHYTDLGNGVASIKIDQFEAQNAPKDMSIAIARTVLPLASQALKSGTDALSAAKAARFDALKKILDKGGVLDEKTMPIVIEAREVYESIGKGGGLVIDLRNNPGGDLEVFRKIASMTLPTGNMMVMTQREPGTDQVMVHEEILTPTFQVISDRPEGAGLDKTEAHEAPRIPLLVPANLPMVVLVNEYSASASELLSGTLQANHRATIVGKTTIGKGVGQSVLSLPYGRSLHVTNFEFFPGGMKSDWIGVIVDVDVTPAADKDTQQEAAVSEIAKQTEQKARRAAAAEEALKKHHEFFKVQNDERIEENNKPVNRQDPSKLH